MHGTVRETTSVVWPRDANRRSISVKLVVELGRKRGTWDEDRPGFFLNPKKH